MAIPTIPVIRNFQSLRLQLNAAFAAVLGNANTFTALQAFGANLFKVGTDQLVAASNRIGIGEASPDYKLDVNGTFGFTPGTSVAPVDNGDVVIEFTDNTTITFKGKGADGTIRTATLTLAP